MVIQVIISLRLKQKYNVHNCNVDHMFDYYRPCNSSKRKTRRWDKEKKVIK